jgi:NAD(P)-dependent dehydrogenase (short-subunit alcohol dehydrogenase family)
MQKFDAVKPHKEKKQRDERGVMVVVITGGAQGLGKILAQEFLQRGDLVNILDVQSMGSVKETNYYQCDVTRQEDVKAVYDKIFFQDKRIDILINNAGLKYYSFLREMSLEEVAKTIEVNFKAVYITTKEVLPYMEETNFGRIINISSAASFRGYKKSSIYSATKAAVNLFTEAVSQELTGNITINAVCPSNIDTEETRKQLGDVDAKTLVAPKRIFRVIEKLIDSNMNGKIVPVVSRESFFSGIFYRFKSCLCMRQYL